MLRIQFALVLFIAGLTSPSLIFGQSEPTMSIPSDSKFVLQLDLKAIKQTKFGAQLFEMAKKKALEEMSNGGEGGPNFEKIKEMLGLDPFEEIQGIAISSSEYDNPEKSMIALIKLKKSSGNIEGLLLGLPGYKSTDYGKFQIHSASPDSKMQIYGAIHGQDKEDRTIVVTPNLEIVKSTLDQLDGKKSTNSAFQKISVGGSSNSMIRLEVFDIPLDKIGEGPQANIAKIIKNLKMDIREEGDNINFKALLNTGTDKQAEQLRQMAQGLIAMLDFAQSMDPNDEDLKKFQKMVRKVQATREGDSVQVSLQVATDEISKLISEELK